MKKNKMMRLASVLLVLVMLTTCVISGTFAKYVTAASDTDSARVAKWGIAIEVAAKEAFADEYAAGTGTASDPSVFAATDVDLVAPGTNGTLATASITGQPEVAYDIDVAVNLELTGWTVTYDDDADDATAEVWYCPLVITVNSTPIKGLDYDTAENFEAAVEAAILEVLVAGGNVTTPGNETAGSTSLKEYAPMSAARAEVLEVEWDWAFEGNNDTADTKLGDLAVAPTISFNLAITATQQD